MRNAMMMVLMATAMMLIACGGGDGTNNWDNGDGGGAGNTSATGANTGSGSSGGGNAEVCHPTMENGWCEGAESCECLPTDSTSEEACAASPYLCPPDGNKCTPGHNQCGYNLPKGVDYEAPFEKCIPYLNGHWREVGPQYDGEIGNSWVANGQLSVGGIIRPDSQEAYSYYTPHVMSGNLLCWNLFNRDSFESAEGKISDDCQTIDMSYYKSGAAEPYQTKQFVFIQ